MNRPAANSARVCVQSFTYNKAQDAYRLRGWLVSTRMDAHVAAMLSKGWKLLNAAEPTSAAQASITLLFGKAYA
jgi:hypothetical protein